MEFFTSNGCRVLIDDVDGDLADLHWCAIRPKRVQYVKRSYRDKGRHRSHYLHRLIVERMLGRSLTRLEYVDHINFDGCDCRRSNLRVATPSQNSHHTRAHERNTSGRKGVSWDRSRGRWLAYIALHGRLRNLGRYDTFELAAAAREAAEKELHGDYACAENMPIT